MEYSCPDLIYKYLDFSGLKKTLENRSFKLSRPVDFNDPLDLFIEEALGLDQSDFLLGFREEFERFICGDIDYSKLHGGSRRDSIILMNQVSKTMSREDKNSFQKEILSIPIDEMFDFLKIENSTKQLLLYLQDSFRRDGIFCSTTDNKNLLMWSHYADKHFGAVIEYCPSREKDSVLLASRPIKYSSVRPLLYRTPADMIRHSFMMSHEDSVAEIIDSLIFTKGLDWAYEKEYRLCVPYMIPDNSNYSTLNFYPEEFTSLYLGCRMTNECKDEAITLAKSINAQVKIYSTVLEKREYGLSFVPVI